MTVITQTPAPVGGSQGRVDIQKNQFDDLIWKKGYEVIHEKSLKCPCVSKHSNQQSNCMNCGGSGWIFFNPNKTRMVIQSMNMNTKYKEWSQENLGTASISTLAIDETSFMDRITVLDGISIFTETLFLKYFQTTYYWNTLFDIKEISYIGLFIGSDQILKPLVYETDFTYDGNKIIFKTIDLYFSSFDNQQLDISVTVRYKHAPQLYIIDSPRETIQSFISVGEGEEAVSLPVHSIGRRAHYVLDRQNFTASRILDNSKEFTFDSFNPPKSSCVC
jgi:hypothetical protein